MYFSRYSRSSKILFNDHAFIWKKDREFFLSCNFSYCISSISKYLEFTTFSGSTFCSGEVLLNWLIKRARFGGGVKRMELLFLETFSDTLLLYNEISHWIASSLSLTLFSRVLHDGKTILLVLAFLKLGI